MLRRAGYSSHRRGQQPFLRVQWLTSGIFLQYGERFGGNSGIVVVGKITSDLSVFNNMGGSADTLFAHIAVNTNPELSGVEWFDRISEEEYNQLTTEKAELLPFHYL